MEDNLFDVLGYPDLDSNPKKPPGPAEANGIKVPLASTHNSTGRKGPSPPSLKMFLLARYSRRNEHVVTQQYQPIKIDHRGPGDVSHEFCEISLAIPDPEDGTFLLELTNPPCDDQVKALIRERQHKWTQEYGQTLVRIALAAKEHGFIRKLAFAIGRVVSLKHIHQTGKRYPVENWKWLAGRTKKSLVTLANALREYRKLCAEAKKKQ